MSNISKENHLIVGVKERVKTVKNDKYSVSDTILSLMNNNHHRNSLKRKLGRKNINAKCTVLVHSKHFESLSTYQFLAAYKRDNLKPCRTR